jgi:hypothetical protein
MRNYINLFFLLMLFLSACGGKKVPPEILQRDDMAEVLTDVHLVDGRIYSIPNQTPDTLYKYELNRYIRVFQQHNTDSVQFRKSLQYYSKHPDLLDEVYTQVVQNLEEKDKQLNHTVDPKHALPAK